MSFSINSSIRALTTFTRDAKRQKHPQLTGFPRSRLPHLSLYSRLQYSTAHPYDHRPARCYHPRPSATRLTHSASWLLRRSSRTSATTRRHDQHFSLARRLMKALVRFLVDISLELRIPRRNLKAMVVPHSRRPSIKLVLKRPARHLYPQIPSVGHSLSFSYCALLVEHFQSLLYIARTGTSSLPPPRSAITPYCFRC